MFKRLFILILMACSPLHVFACGDVQMWVERYFNGQQLTALKFVHCPEIVSNHTNTAESDAQLLTMLLNAMAGYESSKADNESYALCLRNLVVKNFLAFGKLQHLAQSAEYVLLMQQLASSFSMPLPKWKEMVSKHNTLPPAFSLSDDYYSNSDYCELVAGEIASFMGE